MNIELRKPVEDSPLPYVHTYRFRDVFIDGEVRGYFKAVGHGGHGNSFPLFRVDGSQATGPSETQRNGRVWAPKFEASSQHWYQLRHDPRKDGTLLKRDERLVKLVEEAVAIDALPTLAQVKAEREESNAAYRRERAQAEAGKRTEFRAEIKRVLKDVPSGLGLHGTQAEDAILELMMWSQSQ